MADRTRNADTNRSPRADPLNIPIVTAPVRDLSDFAPTFGGGMQSTQGLQIPSPESNLLTNGGFESSNPTDGWTITNATSISPSTTLQTEGNQSLVVTRTTTGPIAFLADLIPVVGGQVLLASADLYHDAILGATERGTANLSITFYDTFGAILPTGVKDRKLLPLTAWTTLQVTDIAPAGAASAMFFLDISSVPANHTMYVDNCVLAPGSAFLGYLTNRAAAPGAARIALTRQLSFFTGHPNELIDLPARFAPAVFTWDINDVNKDQPGCAWDGAAKPDGSPGPSIYLLTESADGTRKQIVWVQGGLLAEDGIRGQICNGGELSNSFQCSNTSGGFVVNTVTHHSLPPAITPLSTKVDVCCYVVTLAANNQVSLRADVSYDGGATWNVGQEIRGSCGVGAGGASTLPLHAMVTFQGEAVNPIQIRAVARVYGGTATNYTFTNVEWSATTVCSEP